MRKVELLPTRDCEAGYGPDYRALFTDYRTFELQNGHWCSLYSTSTKALIIGIRHVDKDKCNYWQNNCSRQQIQTKIINSSITISKYKISVCLNYLNQLHLMLL